MYKKLTITSIAKGRLGKAISKVSVPGCNGAIQYSQDEQALAVKCPPDMPFATAVLFRVN